MSTLTYIGSLFDDRVNPIVIKELRQAVKGKFIASVLSLFLLISLVVLAVFLMASTSSGSLDAGKTALIAFQSILVITCMLFIPTYAMIRLWSERSDANTDLLFITTIPIRAIVWGKWLSASILALLIYTACLPFVTLTYLLRGIDLPTVFFVLSSGYIIIIGMVMFTLFIASLTVSLPIRILLALGTLVVLGYACAGAIGGGYAMVEGGIASYADTWEFWGITASILFSDVTWIALLYLYSVALLKPPSANRALPVRIYKMLFWVLSLIAITIWYFCIKEEEIIVVWLGGMTGLFCFYMLIAICERDTWGPRVARAIPKNPLLRLCAFLLYSGSAGGICWSILMLLLTFGTFLFWCVIFELNMSRGGWFGDFVLYFIKTCIGLALYSYAYCITAMLLQRHLVTRFVKQAQAWALVLLLLGMGTLIPPLLEWFIFDMDLFRQDHSVMIALTNPFIFILDEFYYACMVFVIVWAILVFIVSAPWMFKQWRAFQRLQPNGEQPLLEQNQSTQLFTPPSTPSSTDQAPPALPTDTIDATAPDTEASD